MLGMVAYSRRQKSGHITCYLNRTYHVLPTTIAKTLDTSRDLPLPSHYVVNGSANDHGHVHPRRCRVHDRSLSAQTENSNRETGRLGQAALLFLGNSRFGAFHVIRT